MTDPDLKDLPQHIVDALRGLYFDRTKASDRATIKAMAEWARLYPDQDKFDRVASELVAMFKKEAA